MNLHYRQIESDLQMLIKQRQEQQILSNRESPISSKLIEKYFQNSSFDDRIAFKESIELILYNYSTLDGEIANAVIYHLLYICMQVKVPCRNLIINLLKNESLIGRYDYENNSNIVLVALKVLLTMPITTRPSNELISIAKRKIYSTEFSYCLHFLEIFSRNEIEDGILICLNNLNDLEIPSDKINLAASQLKSTFKNIDPKIIRDWYNSLIEMPHKLTESSFNHVLLKFVKISQPEKTYTSHSWQEIFSLIFAYTGNIYTATSGSDNIHKVANELFPNAYKIMAASGSQELE